MINNRILELYSYAEQQNIDVISLDTRKVECMSVMDSDGDCGIAINPFMLTCEADELVKLAHELGHCQTGSFYNRHAVCDVRSKHEQAANRWAIKRLIPEGELKNACKYCANRFELAEYFGVTEDFMQKAMDFYSKIA